MNHGFSIGMPCNPNRDRIGKFYRQRDDWRGSALLSAARARFIDDRRLSAKLGVAVAMVGAVPQFAS